MSRPSNVDILRCLYERLNTPALTALCSVSNHLPQDTPLPALRFRVDSSDEFDTKTSFGYRQEIVIDVWTSYRGDKTLFAIIDVVDELLHNVPLTLQTGASVLLQHGQQSSGVEPDGVTHHTVLRYTHLTSS